MIIPYLVPYEKEALRLIHNVLMPLLLRERIISPFGKNGLSNDEFSAIVIYFGFIPIV